MSVDQINIEALLQPIPGDTPCGVDLRMDPGDLVFQKVRTGRTEISPQDDPTGSGQQANWKVVIRECEGALTGKTKDLELAGWLTEAWTTQYGFKGLELGLQLLIGLCERFWEGLFPGFEDGQIDPPMRARPLNWLANQKGLLPTVLRCEIVPGAARLRWEDYRNAEVLDKAAELLDRTKYEELVGLGFISSLDWRTRLSAADPAHLASVRDQVGACEAVLGKLDDTTAKHLEGEDRPNLSPLNSLLRDIREHLDEMLEKLAPTEVEGETEQATGTEGVSQQSSGRAGVSGPIQSRADALRRLSEVEAYFRKAEPHSPISALVARAVRWGGMPFEEVLAEVVQDRGTLERIWEILGIRPPGSES